MSTADSHPENAPESAIARTEQRFREVFESSPVGVARVGLDGTWLEVNDRFCEMLGYTHEELLKIRPRDLIHPEDLDHQSKERSRLISGDSQYVSTEIRFILKNGKAIWIALTASLVRDPSATPQYFVFVAHDVSERKVVEGQIRHAMELSSAALGASRIALFRWDFHSGEWQFDGGRPVVGLIPEKLLRNVEGILSLVVPEDRRELFERLNRSAQDGVDFEHEFRATLPGKGKVAWIYARGRPVRDRRGEPAFMTGALVNMTEYRLLRRELQDNHELLRLAESAGRIHPFAVDAVRARRLWWTSDSYHLYGRREELGPPTRDEFLRLVHPEDREKIREIFRLLEKNGRDDFRVEFRTAPVSGKVRWILGIGRIQRDQDGWPLRLVGVDIDITERREAGEAKRRLEKLSVFKRLVTNIAHEINNPLMALTNLLYLITQRSAPADLKQYARMAQQEVARMTYYSKQILRFGRRSSPLRPQKVSEVIKGILDVLQHRYPDVEVITDFRESGLFDCCRDDLEQLFGILLGNAFEAVAAGGRVSVKVVERFHPLQGGVRIVIGDNGKGMNAEVKSRLFEPFFSTKKLTGSGLGLWIASGIVKELDGRLKIRSSQAQAHHGTVVSVFLPSRSSLTSAVASSSNAA